MFSIIIPTYNNLEYLKNCINSIKKNSKYKHEIIIHVNVGNDGTTNYLDKENIKYVIQINGKKRSILNNKKDISERDLLEIVKKDKMLVKYVTNKSFKKIIFVKNRLINILIDE